MTKAERTKVWISRIFGILLSGALMAFLILFYLKLIDSNMFVLGMLGLGSMIMILAAQFMSVKSAPFWSLFSLGVAAVFLVGFLGYLAYLISSGVITA